QSAGFNIAWIIVICVVLALLAYFATEVGLLFGKRSAWNRWFRSLATPSLTYRNRTVWFVLPRNPLCHRKRACFGRCKPDRKPPPRSCYDRSNSRRKDAREWWKQQETRRGNDFSPGAFCVCQGFSGF